MDKLYEHMRRLLAQVDSSFTRYLYPSIHWENRMLGLVGPRGVGKTTLFLQHIKNMGAPQEALYVTLDHLYFANHTLYDTAEAFNKNGGKYLFIDEVHKYPGWSRELKMIYDAFPDLHTYFTGSSVLDIRRGEADLSRRAPEYHMQGLSFREFLAMRHGVQAPLLSLDDILANRAEIPGVAHPLPLFRQYLREGYYPFGGDADFDLELAQAITRTLEVDVPQFADMNAATGRKLKQLMVIISTLCPFKPNMSSLAGQVKVSRNNMEDYLGYMEKAGMIALLRTGAGGLGALGKTEKVYLENTNILFNLCGDKPSEGTVRETFFFNQMRMNHDVTASAFTDFQIADCSFEVGGRSKGAGQLQNAKQGFVVKDDIEYGAPGVVPLWTFGLNY